jgi:hypothetical protein
MVALAAIKNHEFTFFAAADGVHTLNYKNTGEIPK